METAVLSLTITDKKDIACQITTTCKRKHCSSAALLEQDTCKNFLWFFFLKYCQSRPKEDFLNSHNLNNSASSSLRNKNIYVYAVSIFLVLSTNPSGHTSVPLFHTSCSLYCFPLQFYPLPPFCQELPMPFPPLTQTLAEILKHALGPMGRGTLPFSVSFLQPVWLFSPSHVIFRLHSPCYSAAVGQLLLLKPKLQSQLLKLPQIQSIL